VFVGSTQASANNIGKTELIAFQSYEDYADGEKKARTLPVQIVDNHALDHVKIFSKHDFYDNIQNV